MLLENRPESSEPQIENVIPALVKVTEQLQKLIDIGMGATPVSIPVPTACLTRIMTEMCISGGIQIVF
jgi:hypothetical protein